MIKTIVIVGRPNVGKSTLFNSLIGRNEALTSSNPGLTRDRYYSYFLPSRKNRYILIDTGGLIFNNKSSIDKEISIQVDVAINQADLILFVVDINNGQMPLDIQIAQKLRVISKSVMVVANKADTFQKDIFTAEFYGLGFSNIVAVSALHKRNISGLVDEILEILPDSSEEDQADEYLSMCVAGRPNVGKSTLVNRLLGKKRVIVNDRPGTTRNPAKSYFQIKNRKWELIDLAGLCRRNTGKEAEEIISMLAARREIEKADICIFMLDLNQPLTFQDRRIAGWIVEAGTSVIVAGNKKDLVENIKDVDRSYQESFYTEIPFMHFAPFIVISAKTGENIKKIYQELERVLENTFKRISQDKLDMLLPKLINKRPPPEVAKKRPVVIRLYQKDVNPPVFNIVVSHHRVDKIPQHWKNYIRNSIYREYDYYGVPVIVKVVRNKKTVKNNRR